MAISSISTSIPQTQFAHKSHGKHGAGPASASSNSSSSSSTSTESLEQLAREGNPQAIAELKQLERSQTPAVASQIQQSIAQDPTGGAEPGKGEQVDQYA